MIDDTLTPWNQNLANKCKADLGHAPIVQTTLSNPFNLSFKRSTIPYCVYENADGFPWPDDPDFTEDHRGIAFDPNLEGGVQGTSLLEGAPEPHREWQGGWSASTPGRAHRTPRSHSP